MAATWTSRAAAVPTNSQRFLSGLKRKRDAVSGATVTGLDVLEQDEEQEQPALRLGYGPAAVEHPAVSEEADPGDDQRG
jgi:hypothetical protein